jgi:dinuclear metal center YbgI/SA1388 family protein
LSAHRDEILAYFAELLDVDSFDDLGPNGLQVPGSGEVEVLVTGVSGQLELFERAARRGAQLVVTHHGILWDFLPRRIDPRLARRLRVLLENDISLAAYHLPLDAHPRHGNNALLADALGCGTAGRKPFGTYRGRPIGVAASLPDDGVAVGTLAERLSAVTGQPPLVVGDGPAVVRRVGLLSGAAASSLREAIEEGLDAFVTGEPAEHVMADAREAGIHFFAAGHYSTETFGVRRLGELAAERFGIEHIFEDIPNPI